MPKVIKVNVNGTQEEYSGVVTSTGAPNAGDFVVLDPSGKADPSIFPNGFGSDVLTLVAGEALVAGDFVYINGSGQVMKADATAIGKQARGYVNAAVANGANATVYFDDTNFGKTGLTPGATYYLSATAGGITTTPPTTAGQICQEIGFASSATSLRVNIQEPIIRA